MLDCHHSEQPVRPTRPATFRSSTSTPCSLCSGSGHPTRPYEASPSSSPKTLWSRRRSARTVSSPNRGVCPELAPIQVRLAVSWVRTHSTPISSLHPSSRLSSTACLSSTIVLPRVSSSPNRHRLLSLLRQLHRLPLSEHR